jgi:regulatory protein
MSIAGHDAKNVQVVIDPERSSVIKARAVVFRLFKFRPRSEQELVDKLQDKGFDKEITGQTITYFKKLGLIDDAVFAKGWIQSRLNKPYGTRRIKQELKHKGILDEIIATELEKAKAHYDELEIIIKISNKRIRIYKNLDKIKTRRRLQDYLLRRGFSPENIQKALRGIFKNDDRE